ncbi:MAG: DUF4358 domain-containing protein [Eubacterium sp.]|nr:DUF4358 domain-containing protein [Eubacterium sp.]
MKRTIKYLAAVLAAVSMLSVTACGGDNAQNDNSSSAGTVSQDSASQNTDNTVASPSDITAKIKEDIEFPSMADVSARTADYYDIDADKIESVSAFICGSGAAPDEIAVFKLASSDDVAAAKEALEARAAKQKASFEDYKPDEVYKFGENVVSKGQYVALIICADNSAAISVFNSMAQ